MLIVAVGRKAMKRIIHTCCWFVLAFTISIRANDYETMWEDMQRQGFDDLGMRSLSAQYLPLKHNTAEAINLEINGAAFRTSLAEKLQIDPNADWQIAFRVWSLWDQTDSDFWRQHPDDLFRMRAQMTHHFLWTKASGLSQERLEKFATLVTKYIQSRLAGHTADFASNCLRAAQSLQIAANQPLRAKLLASYPDIPLSALVETTNTLSCIWYKPNPEASDGHEPFRLVYHIFHVVDGPITWEYHVAENSPHITVRKHDSQQDDPEKAPLIASARKEVDAEMEREGIKDQFGSCNIYWCAHARV